MSWRYDELTDRTVRLAPERDSRPSDFGSGHGATRRCPFCAGAESDTPAHWLRIDDARGDWLTRVVPNLYPIVEPPDGVHEVVVESPRHVRRFVDLTDDEAGAAAAAWFDRIAAIRRDGYEYALLFKNEGRLAGATLEHVHSQAVGLSPTPDTVEALWRRVGEARLVGLADVWQEDGWRVIAPRAPRVAYEAWLAPLSDGPSADELSRDRSVAARLGRLLQRVVGAATGLARSEGLNLVLHAPPAPHAAPWWIEVMPRRGLAAGFELATGVWINSVDPETAAAKLKESLNG